MAKKDVIINDQDDLDVIHKILIKSKVYNLTAEVVWSALNIMKKDPEISLADAMTRGYYEWIK